MMRRVRALDDQAPRSTYRSRRFPSVLVLVGMLLSLLVVLRPEIATAVPPTTFHSLSPARLLDTRAGASTIDGVSAGGGPIGADQIRQLTVTGRGGVPATGVGAVVLNITATAPTAVSYVTVYPAGEARPNASNLNMVPGQTTAGATHLIADVAGWVPEPESPPPAATTPS
jgi:hypothetical protein